MDTITTTFLSGRIAWAIVVPLIREIAAVLLAFAISKDCRARDNGSGALWGAFTLITPFFAGVIYAVYSRVLTKRQPQTEQGEQQIKTARTLTLWAVLVYIVSLVLALAAFITMAGAGVASLLI